MKRVGRNESCPCKSGKKFKKCCLIQIKDNLLWEERRIMVEKMIKSGGIQMLPPKSTTEEDLNASVPLGDSAVPLESPLGLEV